MDTLLEALDTASASDRDTYRPLFFRLSDQQDRARLEDLLKKRTDISVHDELHGQLSELVRTLSPSKKFSKDELTAAARAHLKDAASHEYGVWVYYPWSKRLVHLLDEAEFARVRTDRNRNKITSEEQAILATKKVGVIGLSVGQSVSLTMALERSFGEIRLADFDTLELSNLNRIRSGVERMGVNKAVNTAREIAELDPYLKVVCFTDGITKENIQRFLSDGGDLDLLVEECDSVDVKIYARQHAKALGIPVVMDMSDRGCLDIERFDKEPERPIMHGWIDHLDLEAAGRPMTNEEKIPYMLPIVGTDTLSTRMKASMIELGHTVGTWPQLATSVVLGGALTGDTYRRIVLDQHQGSGRWYVDLEELIDDAPPLSSAADASNDEVGGIPALDCEVRIDGTLDSAGQERITLLANAGMMAPSAGNSQPWSFRGHPEGFEIHHEPVLSAGRWDPDHLLAHIAIGTCLENVLLKAKDLDLSVDWTLHEAVGPDGIHVNVDLANTSNEKDQSELERDLAMMIDERCTNRKVAERETVEPDTLARLQEVASSIEGCQLHVYDTEEQLSELADLCASAERIRLLDPIGHREFFESELRWTADDAIRTKDGLDLATLELGPSELAALRIVSDSRAVELVRAWKGGKGLERFSTKAIRTASAVVLVSIPKDGPMERIQGGRAAQRVWLEANRSQLAMHPISAPVFMTHAMHIMKDIDAGSLSELVSIEERLTEVLSTNGRQPLFMMRITKAGEPSVRSLRRPIVLTHNTEPVLNK